MIEGAAHHGGLTAVFRVISTLGDEDVALWSKHTQQTVGAGWSRSSQVADRAAQLFVCDSSSFLQHSAAAGLSYPSPVVPTWGLSTLGSSDCI